MTDLTTTLEPGELADLSTSYGLRLALNLAHRALSDTLAEDPDLTVTQRGPLEALRVDLATALAALEEVA